jgi:hypothetical protein
VFDVGGPLAVYWLLRSAGVHAVTALILSGLPPAIGAALGIVRRRRVDAIGVLVLFGIVAGAVVGAVSHSARLVLLEGSVPTAALGLACLGSLLTSRPLMLGVVLETLGPDTPTGREVEEWQASPGGHRVFRFVTIVWAIAYLGEATARVIIVEATSAGTALLIVKVMPWVVTVGMIRWTISYLQRAARKARQAPAARPAAGTVSPPPDTAGQAT